MLKLALLENGNYSIQLGTTVAEITFPELDAIKDQVNEFVSDETSRMLNEDLMGDFTCDGCTI